MSKVKANKSIWSVYGTDELKDKLTGIADESYEGNFTKANVKMLEKGIKEHERRRKPKKPD